MKFVLLSVALILCGVNASPTPQFFGSYPWTPLGNWLQQFQNTFPRFPSIPNFQGGIWNQMRPEAPIQITPPPVPQQVPVQVQTVPQIVPPQPQQHQNIGLNGQQAPNGWYWSNWIQLPVIPQYSQYAQEPPTIVIISHKKPTAETPNNNAVTVESNSNSSATVPSSSPSTNETSANNPTTEASNSNETSTLQATTQMPSTTAAQTSGEQQIIFN